MENVKESSADFNENIEALKYSWHFKKYFKKQKKNKEKKQINLIKCVNFAIDLINHVTFYSANQYTFAFYYNGCIYDLLCADYKSAGFNGKGNF